MARESLHGGLYLVVDPSAGADAVLGKIESALAGGVDVLQVWNHWSEAQDEVAFVEAVLERARPQGVPVLVHERLDLLTAAGADGVHFDAPTLSPAEVRASFGRDVICGVTCGNDLGCARRAERDAADYVSFCSVFPSPSAGDCELVGFDTIAAARRESSLTIFASGGVTPENTAAVAAAGADGVAVISGILGAEDPGAAARAYKRALAAAGADARAGKPA